MLRRIWILAFVACTALALHAQQPALTYIHCGRLLTLTQGNTDLQTEMTVVVEGQKIKRIEKGYSKPPAGATLVDHRDATVLPGLIDCHVHFEFQQSRSSYTEKLTQNPADIAFVSAVYARRTLEAGFTTVRDLGGTGVNVSLRNAINAGLTPGPRMVCAGKALSITGGHGDPTTGARWDLFDPPPGAEDGIADGPDACRTAVRTQVKRGADVIKVCATGGVLSLARDGRLPHYAEDELETIVKTARDLGLVVAAHAHGDDGMRRAVRAGVASIEHGTFMSDTTMDLMVQHGTWYVPTLTAGWAVADSAKADNGFFPKVVQTKALGIGPKIQSTLGRAYKKGVKIAFGTDAGVFPHGKNGLEFGYMADAGMSAPDILRSATVNAASLLGVSETVGSIEPGKWADLVAVPGNPLTDIRQMGRVLWVMKGGVPVD